MIRLLYALCLQLFLVVNSEIVSSDISNSYSNSNTDDSAVRPKVWESLDVSSHLESVLSLVTGSSPRRRLSSKSKHKMFDTETVKTQEEEEKSFYYFITDDNYVGDEEVQLSGYINYNYYSDSDCTGNVTLTSGQGYYNNTCYPADIGEVYKSYRLVGFSNDCTFLKMVAYRNDDCTDYIGTTKQYINSCNNNIDDGVSMSYRGFCSAGVELPLSKESVVFSRYDNDTEETCSSFVSQYYAYTSHNCFAPARAENDNSYYFNCNSNGIASLKYFTGNKTCASSDIIDYAYLTGCLTDSQNSDAEVPDTVTENTRYTVTCGGPSDNLPALLPVSVPTLAPSAATPTKLPSLSPTVAPTVSPSRLTLIIKPPPSTAPTAPPFSSLLEFEVFQEINGISSQEFLSEEELYSTVLRYAIADCMDGVETNNIVDMTVEDGGNFTSFVSSFVATTSNSLRLRSLSKSENRLLTEELLSHEPASGLLAQSKMHTLVNGARINLFYVVSVGSSSLTFQSLTAQLLQAVADGRFNLFLHSHAAAFGALRLMNATAGAITTASAPQSLQEINLDATRKDLLLVQEPISYIPGAIVFVIGLAALLIRNPINKELNPLYSNYLELLDLLLRVGNIVLCFYVLNWMPNIGINIATAVLLLSRILVLVIWGNFSMTYICRSSRSRARLLKLIYTQARDHQWYHYVYFMLYISSMFEMTLLRYLPWTRHAAVSGPLQGYPSTYFYNTCTYMSLVATIMQVVACSLSLFVYSTQEMIENEYFSLLLLFVLSCAQTVRLLLSLFAYCTMPTPERERIREEEAYALDDLYSEASSEASSKTSYSNSNSYFSNGYFNNPMGESTRLNSDDTSSIGSSRIYGTNRKSFLRSRDEESMYDGTSEYSNDGAKLLSERSSAGKKSRYLQPRSQKSEMDNLFDLSFIRGTSFFGGASEYTNDNRSVSELSGTTWSSRKKNNRLQALRHLDDDDDEDEINDNQLLDFSIYHTKDGDLTLLGIPSCPLKKENNLCCSFEREDSALSLRLPSRPASSEMISRTGSFHELVRSNSNILRLQSPISPRGYLNGKPTNSTILKTSFNDINTDNIDAGRNYSADKYEQNEFAHTNPLTIPRDNTSSLRLSNCNMNDLNNNNYLNYKNYTSGSNSNNNSRPNSAGRRRPDHDNSKRNSASFSKN